MAKPIKLTKKNRANHKQLLLHVMDVDWDYETARIIRWIRTSGARKVYLDLFCGAGGTTQGVEQARYKGQQVAIVALGINHDRVAIESHQANHPHTLHLIEDIADVNIEPIARMVEAIRAEFPHIKIVLWASAECTNHSIAKGGESRDADSRSLPEELYRYVTMLKPDLIQIENVKEFRIWGRLRQKNLFEEYNKKANDYFELPHKFDVTKWAHKTTHPKFGVLYSKNNTKWFNAEGMGYSTDSEKGIQEWLIPDKRFIWKGEDGKMVGEYFDRWVKGLKAFGYAYEDKDLNSADFGAITSRTRYFGQFTNGMPLMWPEATHAKKPVRGSGKKKWKPCRPALDLKDTGESMFDPNRKKPIKSKKTWSRVLQGCVSHVPGGKEAFQFLLKFNSMTTKGTFQDTNYNNVGKSVDEPAQTLLSSRHHPYLMTHQFENDFNETSAPAPTVIASQHKKPMHLVQVEYDNTNYYAMVIYETDCEELRQLKRFMAIMGIVDIKMRMLKVPELLRIQGFPENYILRGTLTDQKKFVGNSVEVTIAGKLAECYGPYLFDEITQAAVA